MNFLFPTPFFGIDNFLSENAVKDLHNQILEDISKNEGYANSQWDCLVNTSAQRDDSVTYPMFSFKEHMKNSHHSYIFQNINMS